MLTFSTGFESLGSPQRVNALGVDYHYLETDAGTSIVLSEAGMARNETNPAFQGLLSRSVRLLDTTGVYGNGWEIKDLEPCRVVHMGFQAKPLTLLEQRKKLLRDEYLEGVHRASVFLPESDSGTVTKDYFANDKSEAVAQFFIAGRLASNQSVPVSGPRPWALLTSRTGNQTAFYERLHGPWSRTTEADFNKSARDIKKQIAKILGRYRPLVKLDLHHGNVYSDKNNPTAPDGMLRHMLLDQPRPDGSTYIAQLIRLPKKNHIPA